MLESWLALRTLTLVRKQNEPEIVFISFLYAVIHASIVDGSISFDLGTQANWA